MSGGTVEVADAQDGPYRLRWERVRTAVGEAGYDAVYVTAGPNFAWLTGASPYPGGLPIWLSGLLLPAAGPAIAIVSVMHADILDLDSTEIAEVVTYEDGDDPVGVLERAFSSAGLSPFARLGVEDSLWFSDAAALRAAAPELRLMSAQATFDALRAVKDALELERFRQSGRAVDAGFAAARDTTRAGGTLAEVGLAITSAMLAVGANDPRLGGTFKSYRHEPIEAGAMIDVDIGAAVDGYTVDTARNIFVGTPDPEVTRLHDVVREAYLAAEAVVKPGVSVEAVHEACHATMHAAGYVQPWKVGHGVGLAPSHEAPLLQPGNRTPLEAGMVFTVDPGTFVRRDEPLHIEETVIVTQVGCERLCRFPHELVAV